MRKTATTVVLLGSMLTGCGASADARPAPPSTSPPSAPPSRPMAEPAAPFEVHEWGLVRGGTNDSIVVGGPVPQLRPIAVAKPLLYFHLDGDAPLDVQVTARMGEGGSIVESWPLVPEPVAPSPAGQSSTTPPPVLPPGAQPRAPSVAWSARVTRGSCHHARLPSLVEPPCAGLVDGCEASTLDSVESDDADCVTVGGQAANHLFYRGTLEGVDPLPLLVERLADGRIRVRNRGTEPIPGVLLRVRLANGVRGVRDGATRAAPPAPGASVEIGAPNGPTADAAAEVSTMLRDLGLTAGESAAFRRAWDASLFGLAASAATDVPSPGWPGAVHPLRAEAPTASRTTLVMAAPMAPVRPTDSLVYFLPPAAIEQLATLELAPRPARVSRAIAVWLELPSP